MQLTIQQSYELLDRHGVFAREACTKCTAILGPVRYTRKNESGEWCSRECRGDGTWNVVRTGGRPQKYRNDSTRLKAERLQNAERQKTFRARVQRNGKPPRIFAETKDLQAQKSPLSTTPPYRLVSAVLGAQA